MDICALSSGSSGNCFYVGTSKGSILIDAGIPCKQIKERLASIQKSPKSLKGIFLTHEHSDHVRGADVLARAFHIPLFVTKKTAENCFVCSDTSLIRIIKNTSKTRIAGMQVEAFSKSHHAADPVSYSITEKKKVSIITDAGHICNNIIAHISTSDFIILEANYDEQMLETGPYPYHLKRLIQSNIGHLSNRQAGLSLLEYASPKLQKVLLAHLSKINNTPEIAKSTFASLLRERSDIHPRLEVSVREKPSSVFKI